MQFTARFLGGVRSGDITVSFRYWQRPQVRAGARYDKSRTGGTLVIDALDLTAPEAITSADAARAGFASSDALHAYIDGHRTAGASLYRVRFHVEHGPPPRERGQDAGEAASTIARIERHAATTAFARLALALIAEHPGRRAGDLAALAAMPKPDFKRRVRGLKARGLTQSLEIGYRLTPLGQEVLKRWN